MKSDVKIYKILVTSEDNISRSNIICVTYRVGSSGIYYGAEFYQLSSSFKIDLGESPIGRAFTFKEELHFFGNAVAIAPENRVGIEDWFKKKMKEAFDNNIGISIEEMEKDYLTN